MGVLIASIVGAMALVALGDSISAGTAGAQASSMLVYLERNAAVSLGLSIALVAVSLILLWRFASTDAESIQ